MWEAEEKIMILKNNFFPPNLVGIAVYAVLILGDSFGFMENDQNAFVFKPFYVYLMLVIRAFQRAIVCLKILSLRVPARSASVAWEPQPEVSDK